MAEERGTMKAMPPTRAAGEHPATQSDDPTQIRAQIARTREDMGQTIDELQDRLSPQHVMQQAKDTVHDATVGRMSHAAAAASETASSMAERAREAAGTVATEARAHPVTTALIGAGVAWWLGGSSIFRRGGRSDVEAAGDAEIWDLEPTPSRGWVKDKARRAGNGVRDMASGLTETVQEQGQKVRRRTAIGLERWMDENPLAFGAMALAAGLALGLAAPRTRVENRAMGDTRDALIDRASAAAEDAIGEAASRVKGAIDHVATGGAASQGPGRV